MSISSNSKKFAPGDQHLAAMELLAAKTEGLSKTDRMQLDFALGKAYADVEGPRPFLRTHCSQVTPPSAR